MNFPSTRIRHLFECCDGRRIPLNGEQRTERRGDIPYWGANSIVDYVDEALFDEDLVLLGEDGAPFFERDRPKAFHVTGPVWPNNHIHVLRPSRLVDSRFMAYALNSIDFAPYVEGSTRDKLTQSAMNDIALPCPEREDQTRIANFLDEKTARIDALIAEKGALAALLNEYFAAQLGKTFTQGIHGGEAVSKTGIEWLPTAPTAWRVCKFMSLATIVRGASPRPAGDERYFNGNYIPWVTVAELTKDENIYLDATSSNLTEEGAEFSRKIKSGTLIFSNSGATLGVPKILSMDACANDGVLAFENLSPSLNIIYAYYYLSSLTENLRDRIRQGAGQPNLNTAIVKGIAIPLPPPREQDEIVSFIRTLDENRRALLAHINEHISLLSEYRSSLISAAVTGQLNIDDFQARQLEAA